MGTESHSLSTESESSDSERSTSSSSSGSCSTAIPKKSTAIQCNIQFSSNLVEDSERPAEVRYSPGTSGNQRADSSDSDSECSSLYNSSSSEDEFEYSLPEYEKEREAKRLLEVLKITEGGLLSQRGIRMLLKTGVVHARYSYDSTMAYIVRRGRVQARSAPMCPSGHMLATGPYRTLTSCPSESCAKPITGQAKGWYSLISEQPMALCREKNSFVQLFERCKRAIDAVRAPSGDRIADYYDGLLFRKLHGEKMRRWDDIKEITVFMTMSSDGFEVFKGRNGKKDAWPVSFVILNLQPSFRARASNALIAEFIPGSHDTEFFDSFLFPIVEDLSQLEEGIDVVCYDGIQRHLKAYILFVTADWPAACKLLGFLSHNAKLPCRLCFKEAV